MQEKNLKFTKNYDFEVQCNNVTTFLSHSIATQFQNTQGVFAISVPFYYTLSPCSTLPYHVAIVILLLLLV
jgi:hypothetical protein